MGKVKSTVDDEGIITTEWVSIPYGKGKVEDAKIILAMTLKVSIPYGKGKDITNNLFGFSTNVSIPYGKGKENYIIKASEYNANKVSIPYGKGKVCKHYGIQTDVFSINSLWER